MGSVKPPSEMIAALQTEVFPKLHESRNPDQLPELMESLRQACGAHSVIVWRRDGEELRPLISAGAISPDWAERRGNRSYGAEAGRTGNAICEAPPQGRYPGSDEIGGLGAVAAIPLYTGNDLAGVVEIWWMQAADVAALRHDLLPVLSAGLQRSLLYLLEHEAERRNYLTAVSRLMMLYDVGKVFHGTLDLDELAPIILSRAQNIVEADACVLWLLDPVKKSLYCAAAEGSGTDNFGGLRISAGDAGLGEAISSQQATLQFDVEDEAWAARWGGPLRSLMTVPMVQGGNLLGVLEAVNHPQGAYFTEEHLRLLLDVAKQAAIALRNAQRLQAERRVNELNALMEISKEITATLNLDHVLSTTVNRITSVIPCERCSVALTRRGKWELQAISGEMKVDRGKAGTEELEALHAWLGEAGSDCAARYTEDGVETDREESGEKFTAYFQSSGMHGLLGYMLRDEEGVVGTLLLESSDATALTESHRDLARIFANQVTVALRNAMLYTQMPLAGVLAPLAAQQRKFVSLPSVRRNFAIAGIVGLILFLVFVPWQAKPSGEARVLPAQMVPVSPEVEGVVQRVLVREGDSVKAGDLVAELVGEEHRVALARAAAEYEVVSRRALQLEAAGDLGGASLERARQKQVAAERALLEERVAKTQIYSSISGVVLTPRMEERVGQLVKPGDVLCQIVETQVLLAEVAVPEADIAGIRPGQEAWLKLNSYPASKFVGTVVRVSPQGREQGDSRVFDVIVQVPNQNQMLRAGMLGRGKVLAERLPAGVLLFRAPARWIWMKVWSLLP